MHQVSDLELFFRSQEDVDWAFALHIVKNYSYRRSFAKTLTVFSQTFSVFPYPFSSYRKSTLADDVDVCGDSDDVTEEEDEA